MHSLYPGKALSLWRTGELILSLTKLPSLVLIYSSCDYSNASNCHAHSVHVKPVNYQLNYCKMVPYAQDFAVLTATSILKRLKGNMLKGKVGVHTGGSHRPWCA